ncbi:MAG TPA: anti-sigma factor RsbA family regulatory protein [Solirubrobacterales bacterium]|jgi:anti-sigma regulatory factor (Ser/Thr protein kinase)|nr:anti-sigma factor RsbA family regulatory protein [Solirubrobacterales bacterium]
MDEPGIRHEAVIYRDGDDFLAATVPFLRDALEAGEPALVAVRDSNADLLKGELGADAAEVRFAAIEEIGRNPARIIPFWRDFVDLNRGAPVRGIGEPVWPGRQPAEIDECQRHESLLDVAFSAPPAWSLLCPYDGSALDDEVLSAVGRSHRTVLGVDAGLDLYAEDADGFAGALPDHPADGAGFKFDRTGLFDVRQRVAWTAKSCGLPEQKATDVVVAASELAANSIVHGGGSGVLHVWRENESLLVEIEDRGTIEEPLVGRVKPAPSDVGGRGLWLANQFCDLVQIRSGATGTTVRLQVALA